MQVVLNVPDQFIEKFSRASEEHIEDCEKYLDDLYAALPQELRPTEVVKLAQALLLGYLNHFPPQIFQQMLGALVLSSLQGYEVMTKHQAAESANELLDRLTSNQRKN